MRTASLPRDKPIATESKRRATITESMAKTPLRRAVGIGLALALVGLTVGTVAADLVNQNTLSACVAKDGAARFIDTEAGQTCDTKKEALVTWNVVGPPGPAGPTGPAGPGGGASIAILGLTPGSSCTNTLDYYPVGVGCPGSQGTDQELQATFGYDPADYPAGAVHALEVVMHVNPGKSFCVRLFNVTTQTAVVGSEGCLSNSTTTRAFYLLTTAPTGLGAGTYVLQGLHSEAVFMSSGTGFVYRADLVIDWE